MMNEKKFNIVIEKDPVLKLDVPSVSRKIFNAALVPLLNILPQRMLPLLMKTHRSAEEVVANKTQHTALEILYHRGKSFSSKNFIQKIALWIWFGLDNPRGVRNRLKIVRREIQKELRKQLEMKERVFVLSIASGSARAVLEAIANVVEHYPNRKITVTFLDKNPKATEYSKKLSQELQLFDNPNIDISWETKTVGTYLSNHANSSNFDIIEMVGLLDYFDDKKAITTFEGIRSLLQNNGLFVCANIAANKEQKFVTNFVGWEMIYRSAESLITLLSEAGFSSQEITAYYEPLKVHSVTCAYNTVS